jgi:hypothetical protein
MRAAVITSLLLAALVLPGHALAGGGNYRLDGGSSRERAQVGRALAASTFDWDVVPGRVAVHLVQGVISHSTPGDIWLDTDLLNAGVFSWAIVQDEFAHQVDFLLFDDATRDRMNVALGGQAWCHEARPGLQHAQYGCERFASTLVWSFWPSKLNSYRPKGRHDESAAMAPERFRALVAVVVFERLTALGLAG